MPSLVKKMKGNKAYYYIVQSARVNGKPRIVWQKYLGTVDGILKMAEQNLAPAPSEIELFQAGGVAALLNISKKLDLVKIIDEIVPKRVQGPSVGQYMLLAALNRALNPLSKSPDPYTQVNIHNLKALLPTCLAIVYNPSKSFATQAPHLIYAL